jgi:hypothetical protein
MLYKLKFVCNIRQYLVLFCRKSPEVYNFRFLFVMTSASRERPWRKSSSMAASQVENAFCMIEFAKTNSVTIVQWHFRTRYVKQPPTKQLVYDWSKKFNELGDWKPESCSGAC